MLLVEDLNKLNGKYQAMKQNRSALSQKVKNQLLEDNTYLEGKYLRHKKLAHQSKTLEIKAKYQHQRQIQDLAEEHQQKVQAAVKEAQDKAHMETMGHYQKCLAHVQESVNEQEALRRQLESKERCQGARAEIARLRKDKEELERELAICPVCGSNCSPGQHRRNLKGLKKGGKKLESFWEGLGKGVKQVTLRTYFNQESQKNVGDFGDKAKVQSTLSFFDSASTKMHSPELDHRFLTPEDNKKKLEMY
jgi:DNA repair exonuclease SbcCD ATPase subunit